MVRLCYKLYKSRAETVCATSARLSVHRIEAEDRGLYISANLRIPPIVDIFFNITQRKLHFPTFEGATTAGTDGRHGDGEQPKPNGGRFPKRPNFEP